MSEHVENLRRDAAAWDTKRDDWKDAEEIRALSQLKSEQYNAAADYIEQLEERLRITNELLEAKQEPNNAE